jgi:hypothetical protein
MKKTYHLIGAAFLAVFALASQCLSAAESTITLHVPFAFVVGGKTMPAGAYTVETNGSVVSVRGNTGSAIVTSGPEAVRPAAQPGLIFARRGGATYLVGVRTEDDARMIESRALNAR